MRHNVSEAPVSPRETSDRWQPCQRSYDLLGLENSRPTRPFIRLSREEHATVIVVLRRHSILRHRELIQFRTDYVTDLSLKIRIRRIFLKFHRSANVCYI